MAKLQNPYVVRKRTNDTWAIFRRTYVLKWATKEPVPVGKGFPIRVNYGSKAKATAAMKKINAA